MKVSPFRSIFVLLFLLSCASRLVAIAPGIPEPADRNVIAQLFNWKFSEISAVIPQLKALGYSHVHVSPPQKSNEHVTEWWGRYQPVDFSVIDGPLGSEAEFQAMSDLANQYGIQIIADVVANHTVDISEQPNPPFVTMNGNQVVGETFAQFSPGDFHPRCNANHPSTEQHCWLADKLADLKTESSHVRQVIKDYLLKLSGHGVDGFRFDAAVHIEPGFYSDVLSVVSDKYAFGEIIKDRPSHFQDWINVPEMDYYDFPLTKLMREAFGYGGDLRLLKNPEHRDRALDGNKAIVFVRNHDIDRGQHVDRGIDDAGGRNTYGIGWDERLQKVNQTDVRLAYAYIFGREAGLPYVFVDTKSLSTGTQILEDAYDDSFVVAGIRFHNLCLAGEGGVARREERWQIEEPNVIGWQRGNDRFIVINKADAWYEIVQKTTSLQAGEYREVKTGWPMSVKAGGVIEHWSVPPRSAMMFVLVNGM